jgi:hypothetical protein
MESPTMSYKLNIFKRENYKDSELNNILDKISKHSDLSSREEEFLENYESIEDSDLKDYNYLSLLDLFYLIIRIKKPIICDIKDKMGKINQQIINIDYNHEDCKIILGLKHGSFILSDSNLYKLIYEFKHDNYSLDIQDEYHEKIDFEK